MRFIFPPVTACSVQVTQKIQLNMWQTVHQGKAPHHLPASQLQPVALADFSEQPLSHTLETHALTHMPACTPYSWQHTCISIIYSTKYTVGIAHRAVPVDYVQLTLSAPPD